MEDLKNCPFCGGRDAEIVASYTKYGVVYVECAVCGARSNSFLIVNDKDVLIQKSPGGLRAIEAWNRRAKDDDDDFPF